MGGRVFRWARVSRAMYFAPGDRQTRAATSAGCRRAASMATEHPTLAPTSAIRFGSHFPSFASHCTAAHASWCIAANSFGSRFSTAGARSFVPCFVLFPCPRRSIARTATPRSRSGPTTGSQDERSLLYMWRSTAPGPPSAFTGQNVPAIFIRSAVERVTSLAAGSSSFVPLPPPAGAGHARRERGHGASLRPDADQSRFPERPAGLGAGRSSGTSLRRRS